MNPVPVVVTGLRVLALLAIVLGCVHQPVWAASVSDTGQGSSTAVETRTLRIAFSDLGVRGSASLRGVDGRLWLPFGIRLDEVVTAARLDLRYTYSPSLLPELSHLRVAINDQVIAALPLPQEQAGTEVHRTLDLDPAYFTDYNQLRLDFIGHYTRDCEDPAHTSLWAAISDRSVLELKLAPLPAAPDLAQLPAPFFDRRDNRRLELPVLLPPQAETEILRSAGIVASWFGALADYRSARFPVLTEGLPDRPALVFATNARQPTALRLDPVETPTLRFLRHPAPDDPRQRVPLLVFQGRDAAQLEQAALALVLGQAVMTGDTVRVTAVDPGEPRPAYDAPRWVRTDRPVRLADLVDDPSELQVQGRAPRPININLRLPPDLLTWNRSGVPVDLKYRYTPPATADGSVLTASINGQLIRAFALRPQGGPGGSERLLVPVLGEPLAQEARELLIPAFQLGADNRLQFQFSFEEERSGQCRSVFDDPVRAAIDADSTIDLTGFPHYAAMPDLALFANAGYPYTRYADLAQTTFVLPASPQPSDVETLLFLLGRMGRVTGVPATRFGVHVGEDAPPADRDLLLIGDGLLKRWYAERKLKLADPAREFLAPPPARSARENPLQATLVAASDRRVAIEARGTIAALLGFESPLARGRSVVAFSANDAEGLRALVDVLEDPGRVGRIRGDLAIVRGGEIASYRGEPTYYVGTLSIWRKLWFHLAQHPLLLLLLSVAAGVSLALVLYAYLRRVAERRLGEE
ncbi:cellulose synthase subunit [Fontimonas thermophila]|uniref:Cyclic di-GMP-binding protein n=1 Tax=Fontimonas thermophila TaxID=1076937 RepID=A0A1I2JEW3_9GAMM|nr:cellulose biosynthesis cyclic di-GMP-binding regulatory protein BcsB [Fontimonas thermophila]SFF53094.1 cellulose synthase subunit [Fontimonas thermophila]